VAKEQENYPQAISYYQKALALNEELGRKEGIAIQYGNLGNVYQSQGDLGKAKKNWQISLSLFTEIGAELEIKKLKHWMSETRLKSSI